MLMPRNNRNLLIRKVDLIAKIKENKEKHIKDYQEAVIAYKKEALKQLALLTFQVERGSLDAKLDLTTPVDNTKHYDDTIQMFEWEVADEVSLTQSEFANYVQDQNDLAITARLLNSSYRSAGV